LHFFKYVLIFLKSQQGGISILTIPYLKDETPEDIIVILETYSAGLEYPSSIDPVKTLNWAKGNTAIRDAGVYSLFKFACHRRIRPTIMILAAIQCGIISSEETFGAIKTHKNAVEVDWEYIENALRAKFNGSKH